MSYPLIGIVPQLDITTPMRHVRLFPQYQRSIEKAGGIGVMLPLTNNKDIMNQLAQTFDGFLFTGGQDLNPHLYGEDELENLEATTGYAPERDYFESAFYPLVKKLNKPILAICRGFQIINVLHGGTIIQDLPRQSPDPNFVLHPAWNENREQLHDIFINPNTSLYNIIKRKKVKVNSYHHQGINQLGKGLTVSATSPDGLIEAFDIDDLNFGVAVQWHPEVLYDKQLSDGKIFKAFIENCSNK